MNDAKDELSLPVVQDWPGSGTAAVGYGSIGGIVWDHDGHPVFARQNRAARLVNGGTRQLAVPVQPAASFKGQSNSDIYNISTFLGSIGAAGISEDFLIAETYDTAQTTSASVVDPQIGQRIYEVDPASGLLAFADDNFVFLVDSDDNIVRTVDLCSPVLQLDKCGLVRTRRGLATIDAEGGVEYLRDGSYMHASSKGTHGEEALATSLGGTIMLFDVETKTRKWKQTMSRGSMSRWSRVIGLENPATVLWCNRYEMALVDLREKPKRRQKAVSILNYSDRLSEIKGVDAGFDRGNDVFALTSREILWLSATPSRPMHPVASVKHLLSDEDTSLSLFRGSQAGQDLLTVSSQLVPLSAVACFGRTNGDNLPVSGRDPYFVETWPTIIPQSHITRETSRGTDLYTVGRDGGLFKQTWLRPGDSTQEVLDLPPPDPLPAPRHAAVPHPDDQLPHKDYDLLDVYDAAKPFQLQWLYLWAFKPLENVELEPLDELLDFGMPADRRHKGDEPDASFWTSDALRDHLERAWLDPLEEKAATTEVHPQALRVRRHVINMILEKASKVAEAADEDAQLKMTTAASNIQLAPIFKEMLAAWQVPEDHAHDDDAWEAASQPTQIPRSSQPSQTQPMGYADSFSQPTPGLPSLKVSKKRSGDKRTSKKKKLRR